MNYLKLRGIVYLIALSLSGTVLTGCDAAAKDLGVTQAAPKQGSFTAPPMAVAEFHEDKATDIAGVLFDLSATAEGYFAVKAQGDKRFKLEVKAGENKYIYDLANDGTPEIYPLQFGDGSYSFRVMQQTTADKYIELASTQTDVQLNSEYEPFIRPSQMVNYNESSACVKKAKDFVATAQDELSYISAVYEYIEKNVKYDYDFAASAPKGYVPNPDATLSSGKGICVDYAALAAAMFRSQGIPTKLITGYVSPNDIYHAWNMIYTEENGWITVEIKAGKDQWQRIDLTFAANGSDATFIGDQSNYVEKFFY